MDFDMQVAVKCTELFSQASDLGCVLSDANGHVLHACGPSYAHCRVCTRVGQEAQCGLETHCHGAREAERFGGRYIYLCPMGLTFFVSPITDEDGMQARITVGPFLMVDEQDYAAYDLNEVAGIAPDKVIPVMNEVRTLPYIDTRRVAALSELLFMVVVFISGLAQSGRMLDNEQSTHMQGQISDYLLRLKQDTAQLPYPYRTEQRFLQSIGRGDQNQAQELLNELLGYILFSSGGDIETIRWRIYELLALVSRKAIDVGGDPASIDACLLKWRHNGLNANTVDSLCLWLSKTVRALMDELFTPRKTRHFDLIHHAVQYLYSNYEKKITLDDVAHSVHVSPTYFSRVFKREMGTSMVDFLNRIRIEKSKELLADEHIRLIEVAMQCGFESQSYFNRMFKLFCNITPQQYRKRMQNGEDLGEK